MKGRCSAGWYREFSDLTRKYGHREWDEADVV